MGRLRQRGGRVRSVALAVVLGASGCCGSIPLSLRCGGSEWVSAAARGGRRGSRGLALRARMRGTPHLRHLTGASPATPPLSRFSNPGRCSLGRSAACCVPPCAVLVANSARVLLWAPGRKESPSALRSEAIWGAFSCVLSAAGPTHPRETVFGFCCCVAARLALAGAVEFSGPPPVAPLACWASKSSASL